MWDLLPSLIQNFRQLCTLLDQCILGHDSPFFHIGEPSASLSYSTDQYTIVLLCRKKMQGYQMIMARILPVFKPCNANTKGLSEIWLHWGTRSPLSPESVRGSAPPTLSPVPEWGARRERWSRLGRASSPGLRPGRKSWWRQNSSRDTSTASGTWGE